MLGGSIADLGLPRVANNNLGCHVGSKGALTRVWILLQVAVTSKSLNCCCYCYRGDCNLACATNRPRRALRHSGSCVAGVARAHLASSWCRQGRRSVVALGAGTAQPCMPEHLTLSEAHRVQDDVMTRCRSARWSLHAAGSLSTSAQTTCRLEKWEKGDLSKIIGRVDGRSAGCILHRTRLDCY